MEKYLTREVLVRIPENKNLTNDTDATEQTFFNSKRFTAADLWGLQKNFNRRNQKRNNLFNF